MRSCSSHLAIVAVLLAGGYTSQAVAGDCTPPTANTDATVTCTDNGVPDGSFSYGAGTQDITLQSGRFVKIVAGSGDDSLTAMNGTVSLLNGEDGNDRIQINGGQHGIVTGDNGEDTIEVRRGTVGLILGGASGDRIYLDGAATVTRWIDGDVGTDTLYLLGTGSLNGTKVRNIESLVAQTAGTDWTLTGDFDLDRAIVLFDDTTLAIAPGASVAVRDVLVARQGELRVDGTLNFDPNLRGFDLQGVFSGSGTVSRTSARNTLNVRNTARIAPGSSIGTLTVNSPVRVIGTGAVLEAEIDPAAAQKADLLQVNGAVTGASGLTVEVLPARSGLTATEIVAANDYTVLQATSLDGAPGVVEGASLPALVSVTTVGDPAQSGSVTLRFSELPSSSLGTLTPVASTGNPNHAALASAIGNAATNNGGARLSNGTTLAQAVGSLTNSELAALNGVHGEAFSSHLTVQLEQLDEIAGSVMDHASGLGLPFGAGSAAPEITPGGPTAEEIAALNRVWADIGYVSGDIDGDGGLGDFGYDYFSATVGADLVRTPELTAGLFVGGGMSNMTEHDLIDQDFDTTEFHVGGYGRYDFGEGFKVSGTFGYSFGMTDSDRVVSSLGSFTGGTATSDFTSHSVFAGLRAHKSFQIDALELTPSAGITYSYARQGNAQETGGGDFNFDVDDASADSLLLSVGASVSYPLVTGLDSFAPVAFVRYEFDALAAADDRHDVRMSNPVFGAFDQVGQNRGEHGVVAGAGFSWEIGHTVGISAGYAYSGRSNGEEHGVGGSVTVRF